MHRCPAAGEAVRRLLRLIRFQPIVLVKTVHPGRVSFANGAYRLSQRAVKSLSENAPPVLASARYGDSSPGCSSPWRVRFPPKQLHDACCPRLAVIIHRRVGGVVNSRPSHAQHKFGQHLIEQEMTCRGAPFHSGSSKRPRRDVGELTASIRYPDRSIDAGGDSLSWGDCMA